ncbi:MAG: CCA tRNA nucleotidyltransferase [Candidatus Micrarchaeota archaeon]|nr:CCA tRNA nucleotidyltransferase [Candidatus Micrarchaeota archaeon]
MKCLDPKKAQAVFARVLEKIKPHPAETKRAFEAAAQLIGRLEKHVPRDAKIKLAGSLAKGTDLAGKKEFDIFLLFPRNYRHEQMVRAGLSCARKALRGMRIEERYAEHPYITVHFGDYRADVVPAYNIGSSHEKGSSVDRSALHTDFINSRLDERQKDDVRLLKAFMKNFGIYGAELRIEGFSGYLCELLIVHAGSLLALMEEAADWKEPVIDSAMHHQEGHRKMFPNAPLVVIDPVDPRRNVAAVVAQTSLSRFIFECRRFLKAPSEKFFFSQKRERKLSEIASMIEARGTFCLLVLFPAPRVVPDVLWPQLKKSALAAKKCLEALDFSVFGYYHWSDGKECAILFELDRWHLPAIRKATGPSVKLAQDTEAFVKKHLSALNLHLEHDRMVAVEKRQVQDAKEALARIIKRKDAGFPRMMARALLRARLLEGRQMVQERYRQMLSDYFFAKIC